MRFFLLTINSQKILNFSTHFNYENRFDEIKEKLRNLERKLNLSVNVNLGIANFDDSAYFQPSKNIIKLPPWFLFKYNDIPHNLRITDVNDPRLNDSHFLNAFAAFLNSKISESGLSCICRRADQTTLARVIKLLRDPVLYEKGKDFILGHELAHFFVNQRIKANFSQRLQEVVSIGGIGCGVVLLFWAVAIIPLAHITATVCIGTCALIITSISIGTWIKRSKEETVPHPSLSDIEEEKFADLQAVRILGDAEGGIYYFKTQMIHHLAIRCLHKKAVDALGNNLKDTKHPKLSDRVEYLQEWQREHTRHSHAIYTATGLKLGIWAA
jgi:hypothetical protein